MAKTKGWHYGTCRVGIRPAPHTIAPRAPGNTRPPKERFGSCSEGLHPRLRRHAPTYAHTGTAHTPNTRRRTLHSLPHMDTAHSHTGRGYTGADAHRQPTARPPIHHRSRTRVAFSFGLSLSCTRSVVRSQALTNATLRVPAGGTATSSVDHQLQVHRSATLLPVVLDVLGPGLALDVQQDTP